MDTMKLAPGLYQYTFIYTFIDDCTRYLVAALSSRRTAATTLEFLDHIFDAIPFPQTAPADRQRHRVHGLQGSRRALRHAHQASSDPASSDPASSDPAAHAPPQRQDRACAADDVDRVLCHDDLRQP